MRYNFESYNATIQDDFFLPHEFCDEIKGSKIYVFRTDENTITAGDQNYIEHIYKQAKNQYGSCMPAYAERYIAENTCILDTAEELMTYLSSRETGFSSGTAVTVKSGDFCLVIEADKE